MNDTLVNDRPIMSAEKARPSTSQVIEDLTQNFLNDFNVEEQKEILLGVKSRLSQHYEELRQNHLKGAEDYGKRIEFLQS
ncbi:hypothetical protein KC678_02760 [Candidatus Dojkabacteria bacterium]|uniref:Uncharacterized protein n=1 Tax=Candidatus Dojkabacteria bacterium TaxID=2099670 RepID=A0A955IA88_9BACT|nr:hypothetical protein [Candidatus Dojkabacteria bacterium]